MGDPVPASRGMADASILAKADFPEFGNENNLDGMGRAFCRPTLFSQ